jgi:hypothetical protein
MNILTELDRIMNETIEKLQDAKCPELVTESVAHEWRWLREDIANEDSIEGITRLINRHMARCLYELEEARTSRVYIDGARSGFVAFRDKAVVA